MTELMKKIWFYFIDIFFKLKIFKSIKTTLPYVIFDSNKKQTFFGYHDITPFNKQSNKLLAMAGDIENKPLKTVQKIEVGYFNTDKPNDFIQIGKTTTWCWQQGARLRWFPCSNDQLVIYNKLIDNKYGAVIQNIHTKEIVRQLNFPVYDISSDGKYAASLNFSRLGKLRPGYGYINLPDEINKTDKEDGVWIYDVEDNTKKLVVSLEKLKKVASASEMSYHFHYINHLSFSPSCDRVLFFYIRTNAKKRLVNAYVFHIKTGKLLLLNQGKPCSHFAWKDNASLLMFSKTNSAFAYSMHNTDDVSNQLISPLLIKHDGHPFFIDRDSVITDSYPRGFFNRQNLYFYKLKGTLLKLARIYSPSWYQKEIRCDLHPRLSDNKKEVCIDIPSFCGRKMLIFNIDF